MMTDNAYAPYSLDREEHRRFSRAEQVRHLEAQGFVILPDALDDDHVARLKVELEGLPMRPSFYTDAPSFATVPPHTHGPESGGLVGHAPVVEFVKHLLGDELVFMHSFYIQSHPGAPELELHTDFQPYGSTYSQWLESCPIRIRVLYYLDDTRLDRSALRILPRSHISMHADAQPYRRIKSHAEEVMVPLNAGDAFVFAVRMFHGVGPNTTQERRGMMEYDYRPIWARPYGPLPNWSAAELRFVPEPFRDMAADRNRMDMAFEFDTKRASVETTGPGIGPARWGTAA